MISEEYELNFMDKLWEAANRLRGKVEVSQYKHIVLPLIFLKYVSDMFESRRRWLESAIKDPKNEDYYIPNATEEDIKEILEDRDEYLSAGVFYVPPKARWSFLMKNAMQPDIGKLIDEAMTAIEKENPRQLRGVLPKIYAEALVPSHVLGELINLFSKIGFTLAEDESKDVLGRVYEYFIGKFAEAEGKRGGEFYTPRCVVRLLVEMLEPFEGRVYDPACGSGGMFIQSWKFLQAHKRDPHAISVYGEEVVETTWRICKMNLAIRGIPSENVIRADTLLEHKFRDLKADFIITNPPFNMTKWGADRVKNDVRWKYGIPDDTSKNGGNYAWIQHYIYHLAPNGRAGFVLARGSLSCGGKYGEIRKGIIEDDLVDCIVELPPKLFLTTQIPACLWFLAKNKDERGKGFRDRRGEILFIDARDLYKPISRRLNILANEHIQVIANTYRAWRKGEGYKDVPGFCKSVTLEEVRKNKYVLTPGRYVGIPEEEGEEEPFDEKMRKLTAQLAKQLLEAEELRERIRKNLRRLGYEF
ncbi:MAG: SAM-dependent DNA methyltransferase [Thermoproteota archaeon]|nr:MAG: SAM-dependent DNA methyltransferase [Candidatus Korarchaeota archaeon]